MTEIPAMALHCEKCLPSVLSTYLHVLHPLCFDRLIVEHLEHSMKTAHKDTITNSYIDYFVLSKTNS